MDKADWHLLRNILHHIRYFASSDIFPLGLVLHIWYCPAVPASDHKIWNTALPPIMQWKVINMTSFRQDLHWQAPSQPATLTTRQFRLAQTWWRNSGIMHSSSWINTGIMSSTKSFLVQYLTPLLLDRYRYNGIHFSSWINTGLISCTFLIG